RAAAAGNGRTLLQVRLETGRKNQIRVHMQGIGHPIVGDRRYGGQTDPIERVCLHATELGFAHPVSGQAMRFNSAMPREFRGLVGRGAEILSPEILSPEISDPEVMTPEVLSPAVQGPGLAEGASSTLATRKAVR